MGTKTMSFFNVTGLFFVNFYTTKRREMISYMAIIFVKYVGGWMTPEIVRVDTSVFFYNLYLLP